MPLYVNFGTESYKDGVELTAHEFYERLRTSPRAADDLAADAGRLPRRLRGARARYDRILSVHLASNLSGTFQSANTAAEELGGGRVRTIDSESASVATRCSASRSSAGSSAARATKRSTSSSRATCASTGCSSPSTRSSSSRAAAASARAKAFAGQLMNVKPILSIRDGEVIPVKRVRGNRKAFQEFVDALDTQTRDEPGLRVGIAHADAPERMAELEKMVRDRRPQATIEMETSLGAVIGAHAGPGHGRLLLVRRRRPSVR